MKSRSVLINSLILAITAGSNIAFANENNLDPSRNVFVERTILGNWKPAATAVSDKTPDVDPNTAPGKTSGIPTVPDKQSAKTEMLCEYSKVRVNDRDICYLETGRGERPMLLLHTLRTQIEYTERIVPLLDDRFRVIVPDLPGHGRSSKELTQPYNAALFVETIAALIKKLDLNEVTIVGESIGGTIALSLAAQMPERVSHVVAFNPHDSMGSLIGGPVGSVVSYVGQFTEIPFKLNFPPLFRFILQAGFANNKNLSDEFVDKLLTVPTQDERFPSVMKSMMKEASTWSQIADKEYPNIPNSVPTQVIYGDEDWSPSYAAEQNQRRLPPHVRFATIKNTGHFSFMDNPSGSASIINAAPPLKP